jgi:hypothetical protein
MANQELTETYAEKIRPILNLAKTAYGHRDQVTPAHNASREYTRLLKEYYAEGGSLVVLAQTLGVAYSGMRRRVFTSALPATTQKKRTKRLTEETAQAVERVKAARAVGMDEYHLQLFNEYHDGYSLALIAEGLGLSSSAPLYYAVQRHAIHNVSA